MINPQLHIRVLSSGSQSPISNLEDLSHCQHHARGYDPKCRTISAARKPALPKQTKIYDLVYNPRETKLVRDARAQGLQATTGLGMLIEQAALGFELWTGIKLSSAIFRNAVE